MAEEEDLVANFMAITGADDATALQMLEAANFDMEQAVNLFFAAEAAGGTGGAHGGAHGGGRAGGSRGPGGGGGGRGGANAHHDDFMGEDEVRAPLPTKVERLYGDQYDPRAAMAALAAHHGLGPRGVGPGSAPASQVDVFRDFQAEAAQAAALASAGGSASAGATAPQSAGLSGLFALPADLKFPGDFQAAKALAANESKWLLLNVQSGSEFASHRLNRDTWSQEALKEVLKGMFVFFQADGSSPDGKALVHAYRLGALPVVVVVDPLTGAQLWCRQGFIDPEKLMEELVPFMDHAPHDAGAAGLAENNLKRKAAAAAAAAPAAGGGDFGGAGGSSGLAGRRNMSEDDELAMAIAMSMGDTGPAEAAGADAGDMDDDGMEEAAIYEQIQAAERKAAEEAAAPPRKDPAQVAAEAAARVPAEPPEAAPDAARVALRLPDGSRAQRRFRRGDPVSVLHDYCTSLVPEAAAGRSLIITPAMPGASPLSDLSQTLEAAGVAGSMLVVKLA